MRYAGPRLGMVRVHNMLQIRDWHCLQLVCAGYKAPLEGDCARQGTAQPVKQIKQIQIGRTEMVARQTHADQVLNAFQRSEESGDSSTLHSERYLPIRVLSRCS